MVKLTAVAFQQASALMTALNVRWIASLLLDQADWF